MTAQVFILKVANGRTRMSAAWKAACAILELGNVAKVTVEEAKPTRTLEQSAKMWAMLTDISKQVKWHVDGKLQYITPDDWKIVVTAGLKKTQRIASGIEGGFVALGERTSRMKVGEMVELIDFIGWFAAEHGVNFQGE